MRCGIIGLPNVGKSTLFNCLTSLKAPAENYPFCTVEPNVGSVPVPDRRLDMLNQIFSSEKMIPTSMEFVDIAGLIQGAYKGEGLGNRFLSHIRDVQALLHIVRVFDNKDISHVQGTIDPLRDIQLIETELLLADNEFLENKKAKLIKLAKSQRSNKEIQIELSLVEKLQSFLLESETPARQYQPEPEELPFFHQLCLLTAKPVLYVCNTGEQAPPQSSSPHSGSIKKPVSQPISQNGSSEREPVNSSQQQTDTSWFPILEKKYSSQSILPICADLEMQITELDSPTEKQEFLSELGWKETGLHRLIKKSYQLLNLITFFTAGKKEVRAWTVPQGTLAPAAGGKIHSDFEKGFIKAEVYAFDDIQALKSEKALRASGKYRQEGRNYVVQDGDVLFFRFSPPHSK